MFGRDPYTPKPETLFEPRLLSTTSINQVLPATIIGEKRTQELYHESYFWWMNLANSITIEDIAAVYRCPYGENFTYHTPSEKTNLLWYTQYPDTDKCLSRNFQIIEVWGGDKR